MEYTYLCCDDSLIYMTETLHISNKEMMINNYEIKKRNEKMDLAVNGLLNGWIGELMDESLSCM